MDSVDKSIFIGKMLMSMLDRDPDPRAPEVKRILQGQIDELLEKKRANECGGTSAISDHEPKVEDDGKPPAQVVGLKALSMDIRRTGLG